MSPSIPSEQRAVIVAHKHDTVLYVLAESEACAGRRDRLVARIPEPRKTAQGAYGRRVRGIGPEELDEVATIDSWCLAVLVCAGDRMKRLVTWARGGLEAAQFARVRFYVDTKLDPIPAVEPWISGVSPVADVVTPAKETMLTRLALNQLNDQNYADHAPRKPPGVP